MSELLFWLLEMLMLLLAEVSLPVKDRQTDLLTDWLADWSIISIHRDIS